MLIREPKIVQAIDKALSESRGKMNCAERKFLEKIRHQYLKNARLSVSQKMKAVPLLNRLGYLDASD